MTPIEINFRENFLTSNNIPTKFITSPHFEYFLELYNDDHGSLDKWNELQKELVQNHYTEGKYINLLSETRHKLVENIKNNKYFQRLKEDNMLEYEIPQKVYKSTELYKKCNYGKTILSVDMKEANYQALKWYDSRIVQDTNTWREFVELFTPLHSIQQNKVERQRVLGKLEPKKQQILERWLMYQFVNSLKIYENLELLGWKSDEVLYVLNSDNDKQNIIQAINTIAQRIGISVKTQIFKLECITLLDKQNKSREYHGYVKNYSYPENQKPTLHAVIGHYYPQFFKAWKQLGLNEKDLEFLYDDQIVAFKYPLVKQ